MKTILIGFGDIAEKHFEVLTKLDCNVIGIVTRNIDKALSKAEKYGIPEVYKSIEGIPIDDCDFLMNLTSADMIAPTLEKIISFKKPIFTEKPVGFGIERIDEIIYQNKKFNSPVMVGTNRRFYSIFHKALDYLKKYDKKIDSININAPERLSAVNQEKFNLHIRKNWMFANSIHSVDLIRFFGGDVKKIYSNSTPNEQDYNATGTCQDGIDFSFSSNWKKEKIWNLSILADEVKVVFEPFEKGKIYHKNNVIDLSSSKEDLRFKPGFHAQFLHFLENFVQNNKKSWPSSDLADHKKSLKLVEDIFLTNPKINLG